MGVHMITMVESGRVGNQIFQYLGLRSVAAPGEKIILFGLILQDLKLYQV